MTHLIFDNISIHSYMYTQPTKSICRSAQDWSVGIWQSISELIPKRNMFFPSQLPTACSSSIRAEAFPHPYWHVSRHCHYADFIQASTLLRFHGYSFLVCLEDTSSRCLILTAKGSVALTPLHERFLLQQMKTITEKLTDQNTENKWPWSVRSWLICLQ